MTIVVNCLDLRGQVRQVFIQEIIVVFIARPALWLWPSSSGNSHLRLKIHLHTLELLHLLSQLAKSTLVSIHGHHLLLLLEQEHLLLHHLHLHLDCLGVHLSRSVRVVWRCSISLGILLLLLLSLCDVHNGRREVFIIAILSKQRVLSMLPFSGHYMRDII